MKGDIDILRLELELGGARHTMRSLSVSYQVAQHVLPDHSGPLQVGSKPIDLDDTSSFGIHFYMDPLVKPPFHYPVPPRCTGDYIPIVLDIADRDTRTRDATLPHTRNPERGSGVLKYEPK